MESASPAERAAASWMPNWRRLVHVTMLVSLIAAAGTLVSLGSWRAGAATILWPSNGLLMAILLRNPKRHWPVLICIACFIDLVVNLTLGNPFGLSLYLGGCNMAEATAAAYILYPVLAEKPDLTEPKQLLPFLLYGVGLAPAVTAFLAVWAADAHFGLTSLHDLDDWFVADALGMATVAPLYLAFCTRKVLNGRKLLEVAGLLTLLLVVTAGVFWQREFPFLFVVLPFLLLIEIRLGLGGSALGLLMVTVLGGALTTAGYGPIALIRSKQLSEHILVFQAFIFAAMVMLYAVEVVLAESRRLQASLRASEGQFRLLAEASSDIIGLTDVDGTQQYISPAVAELLGWKAEEIVGTSFRELAHPEDGPVVDEVFQECLEGAPSRSLEFRCKRSDGRYLWVEMRPRLCRDPESGDPIGFVNVARDISQRKREEEELHRAFLDAERMAGQDALTGIANRRQMDNVLEREWRRAIRGQSGLSLLLLDVDRFKAYNDFYGHVTGDECLKQVVAAAKTIIHRPSDLLARFGGEEFVVLLPNTDARGAQQMGERLRLAVEQRRLPHLGNPPYNMITLSVGCATMTPGQASQPLELVEAADRALYQAKSRGRNRVEVAEKFYQAEPDLLTG